MLSCMEDYKSKWGHNVHIAESVETIDGIADAIEDAARKQGDNVTVGHTADKNQTLEGALDRGLDLCRKLHLMARKTGKAQLFADTDFTESSFDDGTEEEQIERCARMARLAQQHLPALATYEVSEGDIAALNAIIEAVKPKEAERDAVGARRTQATGSIPALMKQLSAKLHELDDEIETFMTKPDQQEFRETYFIARRTKDYKGKSKKTEAAS